MKRIDAGRSNQLTVHTAAARLTELDISPPIVVELTPGGCPGPSKTGDRLRRADDGGFDPHIHSDIPTETDDYEQKDDWQMNLNTILDQIAPRQYCFARVPARLRVEPRAGSQINAFAISWLPRWEVCSLGRLKTRYADARGDGPPAPGAVKLLLDGQQRITSLYGIVRGDPPAFFAGDPNRFLNLYFNLDSEEFEFYGPVKMKDDPCWINVTQLMQQGAGNFIAKVM